MSNPIVGFTETYPTYDGITRAVFRRGAGPAVIVIAEMPGITPKVIEFAERVADLGCTAVMPMLFGKPAKAPTIAYTLQSIVPACVSREFSAFALGKTSPIVSWLRALAAHEHEICGGPGVGVVGMCFTGGFALGMMVDDTVIAPVLSQPSLPIAITKSRGRGIGLSDSDLARVKERCAAEEDLCVLGLRFTGDRMVADRFSTLRAELGDSFVAVEIDSSKGNPYGIRTLAHSVLTEDLVDEPGHPTHDALEKVLDLFRTRLLGASAGAGGS